MSYALKTCDIDFSTPVKSSEHHVAATGEDATPPSVGQLHCISHSSMHSRGAQLFPVRTVKALVCMKMTNCPVHFSDCSPCSIPVADHVVVWRHAVPDHSCDYSHSTSCVEHLISACVVVGLCCDTSGELYDLCPQVISLPLDTAKVRLQLQAKGAITPKYK